MSSNAATFLVELNPTALVYLTKLMDDPSNNVKKEDVMTHAAIRQQLQAPALTSGVVDKFKQAGRDEVVQAVPFPVEG